MADLIAKLTVLINEAASGTALDYADGVEGFSGRRLITLLKRGAEAMLVHGETVYLEIGVFRGLTLLSVGDHLKNHKGRPPQVFGIDNFSQFDVDGENKAIVESGITRLGLEEIHLINRDYEDALLNLPEHIGDQKIGVFFVDGPHDYRSQLMCLQMALPHLADDCLIVIDDSNYQHVRLATKDFLLCFPEFKLAFEAYTKCHPKNASLEAQKQVRKTWWDGVNVIVRDREDRLPVLLPDTGNARELCQNEHELQAFRYASQMDVGRNIISCASRLVTTAGALNPTNWLKLAKQCRKLQPSSGTGALFNSMNTYSDQLPESNINPGLMTKQRVR